MRNAHRTMGHWQSRLQRWPRFSAIAALRSISCCAKVGAALKNALEIVGKNNPETILDIATGTGDLAISLTKTSATKIIGLDISEGMLSVGRKKMD